MQTLLEDTKMVLVFDKARIDDEISIAGECDQP